jgi:ribulose-phosphate 3-epimerase
MEPLIVPAIIAQSQGELESMLGRLRGKVDRVMLDIMDGEFVDNASLDFDFELLEGFEYEAHLMVVAPLERIGGLAGKVDFIILHMETLEDVGAAIECVKNLELKVVLALNPETGVDKVEPYLGEVDGVLVMTVVPGRYGGRFLPETLVKCRMIREMHGAIPIEVDGGMNPENARVAREAGANIIASGSFIMKSEDVALSLRLLAARAGENDIKGSSGVI